MYKRQDLPVTVILDDENETELKTNSGYIDAVSYTHLFVCALACVFLIQVVDELF